MSPSGEALAFEARRTREFERSYRELGELRPSAILADARLDDVFVVLVDSEGFWLCPADISSTPGAFVPWNVVGRLRNDWVRRESSDAADVALTLLHLPAHSEVDATVLVVPVHGDGGSADLRITLVQESGIAGDAERRRPRR